MTTTKAREPTRNRCKAEGGMLAILAIASVAASSFSLFRNIAAIEEDRMLGVELEVSSYDEMEKSDDAREEVVLDTGILEGIRSNKPPSFFRNIQKAIDNVYWEDRCTNYDKRFIWFQNGNDNLPKKRKIFYGSLVSEEPWELFEIMGAETYGIFEGMVFVESNRTQMFHPRTLRHNEGTRESLERIFGTRVEIRHYVNENDKPKGLNRENEQRHQILKGWKEMGMRPEDIGYISDVDETFSREFLRAIQTCPYVKPFEYESHKCYQRHSRFTGRSIVYEGSPDCVTAQRRWLKPDMMIGACIEEIGNETEHPLAKRNGWQREVGFASGHGAAAKGSARYLENNANITGNHFPLWTAGDFQMLGGGVQIENSAFHLHNWFANYEKLRIKYKTYGHPVKEAMTKPVHEIHNDLKLMAYCLRNLTDAPTHAEKKNKGKDYTETQDFKRVMGGFLESDKPWPIYFYDEDYRRRKHAAAQANLEQDEQQRAARLQHHELAKESLEEELKEVKRRVWRHEQLRQTKEAEADKKLASELEKRLQKAVSKSEEPESAIKQASEAKDEAVDDDDALV